MKQSDIKLLQESVTDAVELLTLNELLPDIKECLQHYDIFTEYAAQLDKHFGNLNNHMGFKEIMEKGKEKKRLLGELKGFHLRYFRMARNAADVVQFLRKQKNFDSVVVRVTGELQGFDSGLALLNNVVAAERVLRPMIVPRSWKALLEAIAETKNDKDMERVEATLTHVVTNLPEVKVTFSSQGRTLSADSAVVYVTKLLQSGLYEMNTSQSAFYYEQGKSYPEEQLIELAFQLPIFVADDETRQRDISTFLAIHDLAYEIYRKLLQLEECGYPDYSHAQWIFELRLADGQLLAEQTLLSLSQLLQDWTELIAEARDMQPRFEFLTPKQFGSLLGRVKICLEAKQIDASSFLPYISTMHPEKNWEGDVLANVAGPWYKEERSRIRKIPRNQPIAYVRALISALSHLVRSLPSDIVTEMDVQEGAILINASNFDDTDCYNLFIYLHGAAPHRSHILYCTAETKEEEIELICHRAQHFGKSNKPYLLVECDRLSARPRKRLLNILADYQHMPIALIFTSITGMSQYSFVDTTVIEKDDLRNARIEITPVLSIQRLDVLYGDHGCGKTHAIKRELAELVAQGCQALTFAVNEDWDVKRFRDEIEKLDGRQVAVHFALSGYCAYRLLDAFFYNFLLFGLVYDGDVITYVDQAISWWIYVEVSCAPPQDKNFVCSPERVLRRLPVLANCGTVRQHKFSSLDLDEDVILACNFLSASDGFCDVSCDFDSMMVDGAKNLERVASMSRRILSVPRLSDERVQDMAQNVVEFLEATMGIAIPERPMNRKLFFKLLARRIRWLIKRAQYCGMFYG